jgi:hypothetical protein
MTALTDGTLWLLDRAYGDVATLIAQRDARGVYHGPAGGIALHLGGVYQAVECAQLLFSVLAPHLGQQAAAGAAARLALQEHRFGGKKGRREVGPMVHVLDGRCEAQRLYAGTGALADAPAVGADRLLDERLATLSAEGIYQRACVG